MKNIAVGTATSKASLDANFRNIQDNFTELFNRITDDLDALRGTPEATGAMYLKGRTTDGDGGQGVFAWDSSDLSASVTADTLSGIYVAPSSDLTGASGAWVRKNICPAKPEWWATNTPPGATNMTAAIQAAIDSPSKKVVMSGVYLSNELQITHDNTDITGETGAIWTLKYVPTGDETSDNNIAIKLYTPNLPPSYGPRFCSIRNVLFDGSLSDKRKVAIKTEDTSVLNLENISVRFWYGNSSIGLYLCGRDLTSISMAYITAERPILFGRNLHGEGYGYDTDMYHLHDIAIGATTSSGISSGHPCIEVDNDVVLFSLTLDGYQSWNLGSHGLFWDHTNRDDEQSNQIKIDNVRWEQGDTGGWMFYIKTAGDPINNVIINNCWPVKVEQDVNGIYLERITYATLRNCNLRVGEGRTPLFLSTVSHLLTEQIYANTGSPLSFGTMTARFAVPHTQPQDQTGYSIGIFDTLTESNINTDNYVLVNGSKIFNIAKSIPDNASYSILTPSDNGSAVINIHGSTFMGSFYATKNAVTKLTGTVNTYAAQDGTFSHGPGWYVYILDGDINVRNYNTGAASTCNISTTFIE